MLVIVQSGLANLASVARAVERLGVDAVISDDASVIRKASRVILPGVGAAAPAMAGLAARGLDDVVRGLTQPVLGICLGMQLLFESSTEGGSLVPCLGVIEGKVDLLKTAPDEPVPHMGWNQLRFLQPDHPLLHGVSEESFVYYVHSYAAPVGPFSVAATRYGHDFSAIVAKNNFMGCQFHPEKSGAVGSRILENFVKHKSL